MELNVTILVHSLIGYPLPPIWMPGATAPSPPTFCTPLSISHDSCIQKLLLRVTDPRTLWLLPGTCILSLPRDCLSETTSINCPALICIHPWISQRRKLRSRVLTAVSLRRRPSSHQQTRHVRVAMRRPAPRWPFCHHLKHRKRVLPSAQQNTRGSVLYILSSLPSWL